MAESDQAETFVIVGAAGSWSMDWAGWATFGLIATALLTAVMIGAQSSAKATH